MKKSTHTYLKKVVKNKKKWSVNESFIKKTKEEETASKKPGLWLS